MLAGKEPDPVWGQLGKQRSMHNNYLTLPVVFLMLSNHYPLFFATRFNWVIVAIVLAIGPVIRHFFNSRHAGNGSPWWTWAVAAAGIAGIIWLSAAGPPLATTGALPPAPKFAQVHRQLGHHRVALQHVSRRRAGLGRHRRRTDGGAARQQRTDRVHAPSDRCGGGALEISCRRATSPK